MQTQNTNLDFVNGVLGFFRPPPKLSLSEWADKYAYLSPESAAEPGRWKSYGYQRGVLDAITDPAVEKVTLMKSARIGYTKMLNHCIGYHIHQDPCPMLIVQPTVEDAQGYSKDEIAPMLRDTPCLDGLVSEAKSRDSGNTILKKQYPGGTMSIVGANSARGFRRLTVRVVLFDEVDGYPPTAGQEGDQIQLGIMRANTFWNRKIIIGSTPTVKGHSRVEASFNTSDKRYYYVPCLKCGEFQKIEWDRIKWPKNKPEKAEFECCNCSKMISHTKKREMIEQGEWRASQSFDGHAGFFIWAGYSYSPNSTWGHLAKEFLQVKKSPEQLKTFVNTALGRTWEEKGEQPEWSILSARAEPYKPMTIPTAKALLLTAGVDTQDNRLVVSVKAFSEGEESWLVFQGELYGDPDQSIVWKQLDELLEYRFQDASGRVAKIVSMGIDSGGHKTQAVYNYARVRGPRVFALKGARTPGKPIIGRPTQQDVNYMGKMIKGGVQLWPIGTDTAKDTIYSRLKSITSPGPGYSHFPIGTPEEYFMQLTAEKKVTRYVKGFPVAEYVKTRERNDFLDCEVYAYAAAIRAGLAYYQAKKQAQKSGKARKRRVLSNGIE